MIIINIINNCCNNIFFILSAIKALITTIANGNESQHRNHLIIITMQIKTMYYDMPTYQLVLTIVGAINLPPRENNQLRNPYCKLYILPDRRLWCDF